MIPASPAQQKGAVYAAPDTAISTAYRTLILRRLTRLVGGAAVLAALIIADILTGPAMLGLTEVLTGLFTPATADPTTRVIVQDIRLPMTLMAILVGMARPYPQACNSSRRHRTEKATGAKSLAGQIGRPMSMELSRLHNGAAKSNEREKCDQLPQTRASISTRMSKTETSSNSQSARPRSAPITISIRIWPPSRCT